MTTAVHSVPFVLYDPQAGNGQVCRTPVSGIDIFPTAMDYAGITGCSDVVHEWLEDTDAVMPVPDPLYDEEREKSYRERSDASVLKKQEKLRQDMMKKDWRPDPEWWGSQPSVID